ncbi:MAG: PmoA family protein [Verrucomicrobiales bacterium]
MAPMFLWAAPAGALELRESERAIEVWSGGGKLLLRYHKQESEVPEGISDVYRRSGYIHPLMTPDGRELTGDYAVDHAHQHGVFFAWTSGKYDGEKIDFWNQKKEEGRVEHRRVVSTLVKDQRVSFSVELSHFDQRDDDKEILREVWTVTVRGLEGDRYQFDFESRQSIVGEEPLEIVKYHYGGMAVRGNAAWLGADACEFLTSETKSRVEGNHSKPDWVAMLGDLAGRPAAVVVMGHPDNFRAPQPVRIHPDKPYFCFAPMVEEGFMIEPGQEYRSRYRYLISGVELDRDWVDACWKEYAAGR